MSALPENARRHLLETTLRNRHFAFIQLDQTERVIELGGDLAWFGLEQTPVGEELSERFDFLHDQWTSDSHPSEILPRIELMPRRSTDIHLVREGDSTTILFLDVTAEAKRERHYQQKGNELSLALRAWGAAVFERLDSGDFRPLGLMPSWMRSLGIRGEEAAEIIARLPYLENFVEEVGEFWKRSTSDILWSDIWIEEDVGGAELFLEANATILEDGRRLLVVQSANRRSVEHQRILTEARSRNLELQRLRSEVDKKEVLLHCIIHDLKGPLAGMIGSMSLIRKPELGVERKEELLGLGLEQAKHQETMIRGLLDAFVADVEALDHFETELGSAPDLRESIRASLKTYANAYEERGVQLTFEASESLPTPCEICGDFSRLERVLGNLLENALRHSPKGGRVRIGATDLGNCIRVTVDDEGPGVPEVVRETLFQKFSRGRERTGTGGLGLYFCRSTVQKWGGTIGYEPLESGGSRFWLKLDKAN